MEFAVATCRREQLEVGAIKTKETSPLEPDVTENKYYAAEVGNVLTVDLTSGERSELVQITTE